MKAIVLGSGVIGAAVAEALASRGLEVVVLDMRAPGRGASQASAGVLAPYIEAHEHSPLLPLATRSLSLFDDFIDRVRERSGLPIEYAKTGTLEAALDEDDVHRLTAAKAWLDTQRVPCEWIDRPALRVLEPAVNESTLAGLFIPGHAFVGVMSLVRALVGAARRAGASFESPVEAVRVEPSADGVEVRAGERRYSADHVVVAAGTWSSQVRVSGVKTWPVRPVRGQLLQLRWTGSAFPARVVWGPHCYTVPWADGSLLVGATVEDAGFDESSTVEGITALLRAVGQLLPGSAHAALTEVRVGLRPATPDGMPLIGPFQSAPRIVMATGHYRNGILLAPLTAEIVAGYISAGQVDPAFGLTSPDRPYN